MYVHHEDVIAIFKIKVRKRVHGLTKKVVEEKESLQI